MRGRCAILAGVLLAVFGCWVAVLHIVAYDSPTLGMASLTSSFLKGKQLAQITDIIQRDNAVSTSDGQDRQLDMQLPDDVRVFVKEMTGSTNGSKLGYYYTLTYYLFPREVAVTLDTPRFTHDGIEGRDSDSDDEIIASGFQVMIDTTGGGKCRTISSLSFRKPANPYWFESLCDAAVAFLLPLLTALSGLWLLRALFGSLSGRMPLAEQLACGFGLGMMAAAALTLGVKLCGFHGRGWVLALTAAGTLAGLWRDRKLFLTGITGGLRKTVSNPVTAVIGVAGLAVFLILFRLAALQGIVEFDAVADWLFKAKIFFWSTGNELAGWFSNPRLAYAHLDYPTLVPSLHAATYDSIGHVDEFITKFWPTWMLLFLLLALASLSWDGKDRFHPPLFFLFGVLLLPFMQTYVQMEGGTLPMVFFTVVGLVQCVLGLAEKDRFRLGLGLTLMFGAAMTKFEGMIYLGLVAGWMLLLPSVRSSLKPSPPFWRAAAFCFLAALPFICLRARISSTNFESGWVGYAVSHPATTLVSLPKIFLVTMADMFVSSGFARWSAPDGQLQWSGHWDGVLSLYNHLTLGLVWVSLLMTILLWVARPARRPVIVWMLAVFVSAVMAICLVFASFVGVTGMDEVVTKRIADNAAGRYLFPVLLAWGAAMVVLFFGRQEEQKSTPL